MRDPKRIDKFCDLLKEIWKRVPDWRFAQSISNLGSHLEWTPRGFLYAEDAELTNELSGILAKFNEHENKYK